MRKKILVGFVVSGIIFSWINIDSVRGEVQELYYDDGSAETCFANAPGGIGAVRFSVSSTYQILKLKYYITGKSKDINVYVLDKNYNILFSARVTPYAGWFVVNISNYEVFVNGDFYVVAEWIYQPTEGPYIGIDNTPPHHNRSYYGGVSRPSLAGTTEDYLIRAVVERKEEKCEGGWNVSNLKLNKTTFSPGETVSGTVKYEVWNPKSCPACIQQIVVGIDNDAKECIYNGIPNTCPNKTTGTASFSFKAPQSSGIYDIVFGNFYEYTCSDAKAKFPGTKHKTLGTIIVKPSLDPPKLNVTWHVPDQFEYGKPNPLWFETCNSGGDADVEHEMWISGHSLGLVTWNIHSGECIISGWKDNFYVYEEDIEDGYITIRFWAKAVNKAGTDTYDETRKISVVGMKVSIKVIVKDDSGSKLKDASVYLDGSYKGKTNSSGEYTISDLSPGSYTIKMEKENYETYTETIELTPGESKNISVTLSKSFLYYLPYISGTIVIFILLVIILLYEVKKRSKKKVTEKVKKELPPEKIEQIRAQIEEKKKYIENYKKIMEQDLTKKEVVEKLIRQYEEEIKELEK